MKKGLLLLATLMGLVACAQEPESSNTKALDQWYDTGVHSRMVDGKLVPMEQLLSCRKRSSDKTIHYYYTVTKNSGSTGKKSEDGKIVYDNATLAITEVKIHSESTNFKGISITDGAFQKEYIYEQNLVIAVFRFFSSEHESNEAPKEILTISDFGGTRDNQTETEVPGLELGDTLECQ